MIVSVKKAGPLTCLFLFSLCAASPAQESASWISSGLHQKALSQILALNLNEGRTLIQDASDPESLYIASLADALELVITEDQSKFDAYEVAHEKRIEALKKISPATDKSLFVLTELRLHWAFVYLKFGHDFTAAWNIRQAHVSVRESKKKFPSSALISKSSGVLEILLGSVPEKYQWILNLLGMNGSVELGLEQLRQSGNAEGFLGFESNLLTLLIDGFILQQTDSAIAGMENLHFQNPGNRLILFLGASLAIKNSMSEVAMNMLEKLKRLNSGLPIPYADYLLGEVYLHQGNYIKSIQAYQRFIQHYKGKNYVKDAHYKIGIAYWLSNRSEFAQNSFELARTMGREASEADKYAARSLAENLLPNSKLTRARYSTDGGYYDAAFRTLSSIQPDELSSSKEKAEYTYRYARLYHKTEKIDEAKKYYQKTIDQSGDEGWYFAPNSALQLGYLFWDENNAAEAQKYFRKAISYKNHAYKNSIDSKAKSALEKLKNQ